MVPQACGKTDCFAVARNDEEDEQKECPCLYVDGFVVAVPKKKLKAYAKLSKKAGKVWREYGALDYREWVADDVKPGKLTSFPQSVKLKPERNRRVRLDHLQVARPARPDQRQGDGRILVLSPTMKPNTDAVRRQADDLWRLRQPGEGLTRHVFRRIIRAGFVQYPSIKRYHPGGAPARCRLPLLGDPVYFAIQSSGESCATSTRPWPTSPRSAIRLRRAPRSGATVRSTVAATSGIAFVTALAQYLWLDDPTRSSDRVPCGLGGGRAAVGGADLDRDAGALAAASFRPRRRDGPAGDRAVRSGGYRRRAACDPAMEVRAGERCGCCRACGRCWSASACSPRCRLLPRTIALGGAWYFLSGFTVLLIASQSHALSPWTMGLPFAIGQLLLAALLCISLPETTMPKTDVTSAPFAYEGLDRVIHEKARLGLLTSLMAHPKGLAFADLKQLCGLTDGNLSRHLQVLQEAGLVDVIKGYEGNRPHTTCRLTNERPPRASSTISPCSSSWCAMPGCGHRREGRRQGRRRVRAGSVSSPI